MDGVVLRGEGAAGEARLVVAELLQRLADVCLCAGDEEIGKDCGSDQTLAAVEVHGGAVVRSSSRSAGEMTTRKTQVGPSRLAATRNMALQRGVSS